MVSEGVSGLFSSCIRCKYYLLSSLKRILVLVWIKQKQWSNGMIRNQIEDDTTIFYWFWKLNFLLSKIRLPTTLLCTETYVKVGEISLEEEKSVRQKKPQMCSVQKNSSISYQQHEKTVTGKTYFQVLGLL